MQSSRSVSPFSIREAFGFAARTLLKKFWFLLIVHGTVGLVPALIAGNIYRDDPYNHYINAAVQTFLMGGFLSIILSLVDGGKPRFNDLYSKLGLFWRYIATYVLAYIVWGLGLLLLVVPGVIAMIHTAFYGLCIVDEDLGPIEAFKRSSALTKGCRWKLLGFFSLLMVSAVPIALATCLVLAIPAVIINNLFLHISAIRLLAGMALFCFPPALIFGELAWAHCYRQLTKNEQDSSEFNNADLEKAQQKVTAAHKKLVENKTRLMAAKYKVEAAVGKLGSVRTVLVEGTLQEIGRRLEMVHMFSQGPIPKDMFDPKTSLGMAGGSVEYVADHACRLLEQYLLPPDEALLEESGQEKWTPQTINTGEVPWTPALISEVAKGVDQLATEVESLLPTIDRIASIVERTFKAIHDADNWSLDSMKRMTSNVEGNVTSIAQMFDQIESASNSYFGTNLQLISFANRLKWSTLSQNERDAQLNSRVEEESLV